MFDVFTSVAIKQWDAISSMGLFFSSVIDIIYLTIKGFTVFLDFTCIPTSVLGVVMITETTSIISLIIDELILLSEMGTT